MSENEIRIFGPPGTGKTTYLARQIRKAVEKLGSEAVLVASFTKAAATELASRDLPLDRSAVGTLHAHCFRMIGGGELAEKHLDHWNTSQRDAALTESPVDVDDPYDDKKHVEMTKADKFFVHSQILRARMVPMEKWPPGVSNFYERWKKWKDDNEYIDFTDMLEIAYRDYEGCPGGRTIGFFDEAQDFTRLELSLVRKWGRDMSAFILAGDDDQCLYNFTGATPDAFLDPPLPPEQIRVLGQSYRLPRAVYEYSDSFVKKLSRRQEKEFKPRDFEGVVVHTPACTWKNPLWLVRDAVKWSEKEDKRILILASCAYMLGPVIGAMRDAGVPFHNPYRRKNGAWNPLMKRRGVSTADRIRSFVAIEDGAMWSRQNVGDFVEIIDKDSGILIRGGKSAAKRIASLDGRLEMDTHELAQVFNMEWLEDMLFGLHDEKKKAIDYLDGCVMGSKKKVAGFPIRIIRNHGRAVLARQPRIAVGTIHSVKGGQADVVYVFPDLSRNGMEQYINTPEGRDATIRQFYVAFTRAKERLVLCRAETSWMIQL